MVKDHGSFGDVTRPRGKKTSNPDEPFFKALNANKFGNHSINEIIKRDNKGNPTLGRCNCSKSTYHVVIDGKTNWNENLTIHGNKQAKKQKELS